MYLLENTEEAYTMRQNLCDMLRSHDESMHTLAFSLIKEGGVHEDFAIWLCMHTIKEFWEYKEDTPARKLLRRIWSYRQVNHILKILNHTYHWSDFCAHFTLLVKQYPRFSLTHYWENLMRAIYEWTEENETICLRHNICVEAVKKNINKNIYYNYGSPSYSILSLNNFYLDDLPDALEVVEAECLILENNPFRKIKRKTWKNNHVKFIAPPNPPYEFSDLTYKILGQCFPQILPKIMENIRKKTPVAIGLLKCIPAEKRDIAFYKKCAETYKTNKKYALAIKCYLFLQEKYPHSEEIFYFRIAECYALLKNEDKMLFYLKKQLEDKNFNLSNDFYQSSAFRAYHRKKAISMLFEE